MENIYFGSRLCRNEYIFNYLFIQLTSILAIIKYKNIDWIFCSIDCNSIQLICFPNSPVHADKVFQCQRMGTKRQFNLIFIFTFEFIANGCSKTNLNSLNQMTYKNIA
ncbi:hypothetical protein BpHYR1_048396 [Brachionus plicatilis]|uniref:Uncharacterized protein n=1 Tax=Brachionus plicatilis TaxID=10195 RepID=A0A3M7SZH3_BRAPC|nr:hypothetical protein BpHYR1_048396 [Brachionus plicatilis]